MSSVDFASIRAAMEPLLLAVRFLMTHGSLVIIGATLLCFLLFWEGDAALTRRRKKRSRVSQLQATCCSVCLGGARCESGESLKHLPTWACDHLVHQKCLDLWPRLHPHCPVCFMDARRSPTTAAGQPDGG